MKKKKTKKFKVKSLIFIGIIIIFLGLFFLYRKERVKNIYVSGNSFFTEQEIIDLANLQKYPYLCDVSPKKIRKNFLENPLIKDVKISKSLTGVLEIDVIEHQILFKDSKKDNYILDDGSYVYYDRELIGIPLLLNQVVEDVQDKFIESFLKVKKDILLKISEISYEATELDHERFLLYMNDGNYVYITLSKIDNLNTYNDILPTLEGRKGILYLDSGNHFEIKNNK